MRNWLRWLAGATERPRGYWTHDPTCCGGDPFCDYCALQRAFDDVRRYDRSNLKFQRDSTKTLNQILAYIVNQHGPFRVPQHVQEKDAESYETMVDHIDRTLVLAPSRDAVPVGARCRG